MLKYTDYDIVFSEVPGEVTLAVDLSLCPNRCEGCHSPQLRLDIGKELTKEDLAALIERFSSGITCVALMGGDNDPQALSKLVQETRRRYPTLKYAWYSGRSELPEGMEPQVWDFIKLGPYIPSCGSLKMPTTNQRFYRVKADGTMDDITSVFWKKTFGE
ncbi:MAG: 4Fe-4S cluster-binding domain-containing protein [Bacteroidaceae bacterium]|nr:4Fe-4S cluster-binding domain-containing protein [Bacteroidaceae bacterium]